jgi:hypothetical protein
MAAVEELVDYTTKHGANLYEQGTKALGTPFSMKASQVVIFEKELQDKASMMGWDKGAQNILKLTNKDGRQISLIAEYGQSMPTHSKQDASPSFLPQASTQTSEQRKTMNKCGAVCITASPRRPKQLCLPIVRTTNS